MVNVNSGEIMKPTGIKVTEQEREAVETSWKVSGMYLSGGKPMGDPAYEVHLLAKKYNAPEGAGFDLKTGEFMLPEG